MRYIIFTLLLLSSSIFAEKRIVGYFANWQIYTQGHEYTVDKVPFDKLTHIQYAFYLPQTDGTIKSSDTWADQVVLDGANGGLKLVEEAHKHGVKVVASVGGWSGSDNFPGIAGDIEKIKVFANSAKELIKKYNFDGIDIDWEYPCFSEHNGTANDDENFVTLLSILRDTLNSFNEHKIISLAVPGNSYLGQYYKVNEFDQYIDFISVMTYDYTGDWDNISWHNSPLYDDGKSEHGSFHKGMSYYEGVGYSKDKINGGIAFYGRSFAECSGPNQSANGVGVEDGYVSYRTCENGLENGDYTYYWDNDAKVPYLLTNNGEYITYDDTMSIRLKGEYIVQNGYGGAMIWELSLGMLNDASQPLLDALYSSLNSSNSLNVINNKNENYLSIYPNPFNPVTIINFNSISNSGEIKIYNSIGQLIENYKINKKGLINIKFNGEKYSSGVYFVRAITKGSIITKKMILLK